MDLASDGEVVRLVVESAPPGWLVAEDFADYCWKKDPSVVAKQLNELTSSSSTSSPSPQQARSTMHFACCGGLLLVCWPGLQFLKGKVESLARVNIEAINFFAHIKAAPWWFLC